MRDTIKKYHIYIAAFITVFFWASAFPAVKYCLGYYSPEAIMLLRFLAASLALFIYCFFTGVKMPDKKDLPVFAINGFVGIFLYMWMFNTGTGMITSGLSSFIIATAPVVTLILSIIFLNEKAGKTSWAGILISLAGLVVVASTQVKGLSINMGVLLLLGATLCTSIYNILQRGLLKKYSPMQTTSFVIFFATAFMMVFLPKLIHELPAVPMRVNLVIVYLGVFPAALAYFTWGYALSKAEKTVQVTSFLYLVPFIASTISYIWLGERLELLALVGGVIIITGMIVANIKKETTAPPKS